MAMTGALTRKVMFKRSPAGVLSLIGLGAGSTGQLVIGVLSFAGALTRKAMFKRSITGTLNIAGTSSKIKRVSQIIVGVLSFAGALTQTVRFKRTIIGTITSAGVVAKTFFKHKRIITGVLLIRGVSRGIAAFVMKGLTRLGFNMIFK